MKPKVARIISYLPVGGVEKRLLAVLKKLKNDFEVEVICIHSRGKLAPIFEESGIPVTVIPFRSRLHPVSLYRLASYLRRRRIDIVHTHMYRANVSGTLAARMAGVRVVISNVHNVDHWDSRRQILMDRLLHPLRDVVIAVSQAVARDIVEKTKIPIEKIVVLYNGVDLSEISLEGRDLEFLKKELGIPKNCFVIAMVARIVPRKGHKNLFKAIRNLGLCRSYLRVLIVGEGFYRETLERLVEAEGAREVFFLGERGDVPEILALSHVSVLPSKREGFSNVILESMATKTPVIASEVGGAKEAIEPYHTGILVKYKDITALKSALLQLHSSPILRRSIGIKSSRKITDRFTIDEMAEHTQRLYLNLLGAGRCKRY